MEADEEEGGQQPERKDAETTADTSMRSSDNNNNDTSTGTWVADLESEEEKSNPGDDGLLTVSLTPEDREGMNADEGNAAAVTGGEEPMEESAEPDTRSLVTSSPVRTDTGTSESGRRPVSQLTNVARNRLYRDKLFEIDKVDNTGGVDLSSRGTLSQAGDDRYKWTYQWSDPDYRMNVSSSFDLNSFTCKGCENKHKLHDHLGRAVICITDQMFVPAVPTASGGQCIGIIRIEDGSITELSAFLKEHVIHHLWGGSVVLIAAGTQLARCGLAAYTADLAAAVGDLTRCLPKGCRVSHCPIMFMRGTEDKPWLDSVRDLVNWLEKGAARESGTATLYLTDSHKAMMSVIECNEMDERASLSTATRVVMPASLGDRTPTTYQIGGGLMPDRISEFTQLQQCEIIQKMIVELVNKAKVTLSGGIRYKYVDPIPEPAHASAAVLDQVEQTNSSHLIFVGSGHAARMRVCASNAGMDSTYISQKQITRASVAETRKKILDHLDDLSEETKGKTTIVYAALDNQAFTSFEEDSATSGEDSGNGVTHYPGYLTTVPEPTFRRLIELSLPALTVDSKVAAVIVMPLPRFFNGKGCCNSSAHVTNVRDPNFKKDMLKAVAVGKNAVNKYLVNGDHYLVRAINSAPKLTDELSSTLSGDDDSTSSSSSGNMGYLQLDQYRVIIDEAMETALQLRQKRSQYEGKERAEVYNRNVAAYRELARAGSSGTGGGHVEGRQGNPPGGPPGGRTRDRPYDIPRSAYTSGSYNTARSDSESYDRNRPDPGNTSYTAHRSGSESYDRNRYDAQEPNTTQRQQSTFFGARDIRYMSEEELEADRRSRAPAHSYRGGRPDNDSGRRDVDRRAGEEASGPSRQPGPLTGTASRRGRGGGSGGGLQNLGRYTKSF